MAASLLDNDISNLKGQRDALKAKRAEMNARSDTQEALRENTEELRHIEHELRATRQRRSYLLKNAKSPSYAGSRASDGGGQVRYRTLSGSP